MGNKTTEELVEVAYMTKEELIEAADALTGKNVKELPIEAVLRLMTVTQFVTDLCMNEVENRGELTYYGGTVVVPYLCDHGVETVLTRA